MRAKALSLSKPLTEHISLERTVRVRRKRCFGVCYELGEEFCWKDNGANKSFTPKLSENGKEIQLGIRFS